MSRPVTFDPALLDTHCIIDARTPAEFAEDHLPGAVNLPILSDADRVLVGTCYKQEGPTPARELGLQLTCHRVFPLVQSAKQVAHGRPILVYCWRGGLRSESLTMLLTMASLPAVKLQGGYKAYRQNVCRYFEALPLPAPLLVLHGMTGSGKTELLTRLDTKRFSVIDLEGLARHRGSAFGALGLQEQPSQKQFESLLWNAFRCCSPDRAIVLEGESRRIGRVSLPGHLHERMAMETKIWCTVSVQTRVQRLANEYALKEYQQPMLEALERIKPKLEHETFTLLHDDILAWRPEAIARQLIERYYDRLYYRVRRWEPEATICLEDYALAEKKIAEVALQALQHRTAVFSEHQA